MSISTNDAKVKICCAGWSITGLISTQRILIFGKTFLWNLNEGIFIPGRNLTETASTLRRRQAKTTSWSSPSTSSATSPASSDSSNAWTAAAWSRWRRSKFSQPRVRVPGPPGQSGPSGKFQHQGCLPCYRLWYIWQFVCVYVFAIGARTGRARKTKHMFCFPWVGLRGRHLARW